MQLLLDHIAAVVIMGLLIMAAAVVQVRGQQATVEASVHDMTKARAQSLIEVLEQDLENMGAGSDPGESDSSSPAYFECSGTHDGTRTTRFHFSAVEDPDDPTSDPADLTYELSPVLTPGGDPRTVRIGSDEAPVFEMARLEDGTPSGGSGALLTHFEIEVATDEGTFTVVDGDCPGSNPSGSDVRAARISFIAALPTVERVANDQVSTSGLNASRYGLTVRPPSMAVFP